MQKPFMIAVMAIAAGWSTDTLAADEVDALLPAAAAPGSPLVSLELSGRWRARGHFFRDVDLGNGTSGVRSTLSTAPHNAGIEGIDASNDIAMGDLRLRLTPELHIGSRAAIHSQIDAVGAAMVLGDHPADPTLLTRSLGFAGNGPTRGSMLVRRLWASFDAFGMATLEIGKVGDHFGLGITRNAGLNARADFQSDIDRVGIRAELFGFRFLLARDVMASLPRLPRGPGPEEIPMGLLDGGDVIRWLFEIHGGAAQGAGFGWGAAISYQDQDVALALEHDADFSAKLDENCTQNLSCTQVVPRGASLLAPQAYARFQRRTSLGELKVTGEVAFTLGTLDNTDTLAATNTSKTVLAGGFAGVAELVTKNTTWKLSLGGATGDSEGGFGVLDRSNLTVDKGGEKVQREWLTGFRFHRGYLVDALLFREVIGAITNAWYARPAWRYRLHTSGDVRAWAEIGCLAAVAFSASATPGQGRVLGLEPDLLLGLQHDRRHSALLHATWLAPGAAFDAGKNGARPTNAWRLLLEWHTRF